MDTISHDFVVPVMQILFDHNTCSGLEEAELLGYKYGDIANEVVENSCICKLTIPGLYCDELYILPNAPSFKKLLGKESLPHPASMARVVTFSVSARELVYRKEHVQFYNPLYGKMSRVMDLCRFVRTRELVLEEFGSEGEAGSFTKFYEVAPDMTAFFNKVVLRYQETDVFEKVAEMFLEAKNLESLEFLDPHLRDLFHGYFDGDTFFTDITWNDPPLWFQQFVKKAFHQPQLVHLDLNSPYVDWIPTDFLCPLFEDWFKNPETFPRGFSAPQRIQVVGRPFAGHSRRFEFNFKSVDKTIFHMNPRFDCRDTFVVMNSQREGKWQREERHHQWFSLGKLFTVDFVAQNGAIAVYLDGEHYYTFKLRDSAHEIEIFEIAGEVDVQSVSVY
ncbi:hypothetical protein QR680_008063 [Steinernema hermaphroditum]|uniref:Galectin n=1 Tax=Steinernema hermaphroditum TaxID=289476 RepID=A0AA39IF74_9BILA|nr:hypothetical protein QR680_008063 [Steinernema hermaphroditum]